MKSIFYKQYGQDIPPQGSVLFHYYLKTNKQPTTKKKKKHCNVENIYWVAGDPVPQINRRLTNVKILML